MHSVCTLLLFTFLLLLTIQQCAPNCSICKGKKCHECRNGFILNTKTNRCNTSPIPFIIAGSIIASFLLVGLLIFVGCVCRFGWHNLLYPLRKTAVPFTQKVQNPTVTHLPQDSDIPSMQLNNLNNMQPQNVQNIIRTPRERESYRVNAT